MDANVDPGDNFYQYANGQWLNTVQIPDDHALVGAFSVLGDETFDCVVSAIEALEKISMPMVKTGVKSSIYTIHLWIKNALKPPARAAFQTILLRLNRHKITPIYLPSWPSRT